MHHAAKRPERGRQTYEFAGYIACIHCGLTLRCQGHAVTGHLYYRDTFKSRRLPCTNGGELTVRADLAQQQFGDLLKSLVLPASWREDIRRQMLAQAQEAGLTTETLEREKERLKLKKYRVLKQHREGYIDDEEFQGEIAAVEFALRQLDMPEVGGVKFEEVIEAGEHIPGMAVLWDVATPEERRDMVLLLFEPGGFYYDLENKVIAAIKPRPTFLPILRMLNGVVEYDEAKGLLVTERWQDRNRRATGLRSPLAFVPESIHEHIREVQCRPGPSNPQWKIPQSEWPNVLYRVEQGETLRQIASHYSVSYEAVRRVVSAAQKEGSVD